MKLLAKKVKFKLAKLNYGEIQKKTFTYIH